MMATTKPTDPLDITGLMNDPQDVVEPGPYDQYTPEERASLLEEEADRLRPLNQGEIDRNLDRLHNPPITDSRIDAINQLASWNDRMEAKLDILIELLHGVPVKDVPLHKQQGIRADQPVVHPPEDVNLPPVTEIQLDAEHPTGVRP